MANPDGVNQFGGFTTELPYGEKKRQGDLERLAPAAAINAPDRAQDRATRPRRGQPATAPAAAAPAAPAEPQPEAVVAQFWRQLAGEVDDPLIRQYADEF